MDLINFHLKQLNTINLSRFQAAALTVVFAEGNTFQNRKVSSPAPVTIVCRQTQETQFYVKNTCQCDCFVMTYEKFIPDHRVTWLGRVHANYGLLELQPIKTTNQERPQIK